MVNNWLDIIQHYLLPPTCILCGNRGIQYKDLCSYCYKDLLPNNSCCYRCAENFPINHSIPQLCGHCIKNSPAYDETHAPFIYQHAMRYLISQLKFNHQYKNARLLGTLLAEHVRKNSELPELIIPMPLHKNRYRQRGFNQSYEIAKTVSRKLAIPLDAHCCSRVIDTPHQSQLSAKQRLHNIKNAFAITRPVQANHIAILDDVMTTGATSNELARMLKKTSISRVDIWVCARA